jgi:hypothetical protein
MKLLPHCISCAFLNIMASLLCLWVVMMKTKADYIDNKQDKLTGTNFLAINRVNFKQDLREEADARGVPLAVVFKEFGKKENLAPREWGQFALNAQSEGRPDFALALLYHALELKPDTAKQFNLVGRYLGIRLDDAALQGASHAADDMLGLRRGTLHPAGVMPVSDYHCQKETGNTELVPALTLALREKAEPKIPQPVVPQIGGITGFIQKLRR